MKLWIDDIRPAPTGYMLCKSVNEAIKFCNQMLTSHNELLIEEINLDHDAGDYAKDGGDYSRFLSWLEEKYIIDGWKINTIFHIHSMNPVGKRNMFNIIKNNGWAFY